ncbi:hypothetical protein ABH931_001574 [Streptacidiphilus sp. MAP12-33]|uniref:hypothetical protein n=1 Tax=Streptacidiphilus sp. MAP12-33 TaxID=3156266 RepID=UPI003510EF91
MALRRPAAVEFVLTDEVGVRYRVGVVRSGMVRWNYERIGLGFALGPWLANLIVHWAVFRGGWTVLVLSADGHAVVRKTRCRDRASAQRAAAELRERGVAAVR